jgi:hypothetical protein
MSRDLEPYRPYVSAGPQEHLSSLLLPLQYRCTPYALDCDPTDCHESRLRLARRFDRLTAQPSGCLQERSSAFSTANPFSRLSRIMGPKRASDGDLNQHQQLPKLPKIEQDDAHGYVTASPLSARGAPNSDFSGSVKKKLANSTRTGQACDRCKVRVCPLAAATTTQTRWHGVIHDYFMTAAFGFADYRLPLFALAPFP